MCGGLERPELLRSTQRYRQGRREANLGPKEPSIDPARAFEVCRGGVFACSKRAMYASRSKSCREPFRVESKGNVGQPWVKGAQWGVLSPCERSQHVWGANPMYEVHLR